MFFNTLAFAMAQPQGGGASQNPLMAFMPLIILFAIFYFLLIRPQQKKAKQHREMLNSLRKGDMVITGGGLYGRIVDIDGDTLSLDVGNKVVVKVNRNYISALVSGKGAGQQEKK
jgi:preprotein translocase subunit YajC